MAIVDWSEFKTLRVFLKMSIYVTYQPIDIGTIQNKLFPFILGCNVLVDFRQDYGDLEKASSVLVPVRNAYAAFLKGTDYIDPEWGRCDPEEFLLDHTIRSVLSSFEFLYPSFMGKGFTSIHLLPEHFPVLQYYQMPSYLFTPLIQELPFLGPPLESIVEASEFMGGVIPSENVKHVRSAIEAEISRRRTSHDSSLEEDGTIELFQALNYSEQNNLSFTEVIE